MSEFDEVRDFVVVGSGGGAMCASLVLRAAGKDVLVLEKTDLLGGTTARSGGVMWIPNNPFMRRDGVEEDVVFAHRTSASFNPHGVAADQRVCHPQRARQNKDRARG